MVCLAVALVTCLVYAIRKIWREDHEASSRQVFVTDQASDKKRLRTEQNTVVNYSRSRQQRDECRLHLPGIYNAATASVDTPCKQHGTAAALSDTQLHAIAD